MHLALMHEKLIVVAVISRHDDDDDVDNVIICCFPEQCPKTFARDLDAVIVIP